MKVIDQVGKTAFIIAQLRHEEKLQETVLFKDNIAHVFLNPESIKLVESLKEIIPEAAMIVRCRTPYFDNKFESAIKRGVKQFVILGAGFDCRSIRFSKEKCIFIEVDKKDSLQYKQDCLEKYKIDSPSKYIYGNYLEMDLLNELKSKGFDPTEPTYFLWEGNTMYLPEEKVNQLLKTLFQEVKSFEISFDFFSRDLILKKSNDQRLIEYVELFEEMGAPWHFGLNNISELCFDSKYNFVDDYSLLDLGKHYLPNSDLDFSVFKHYFVCTIKK